MLSFADSFTQHTQNNFITTITTKSVIIAPLTGFDTLSICVKLGDDTCFDKWAFSTVLYSMSQFWQDGFY